MLNAMWEGCRRPTKRPALRTKSQCSLPESGLRFGRLWQLAAHSGPSTAVILGHRLFHAEQLTLNQRVQGSSPCAPTISPYKHANFSYDLKRAALARIRLARTGGSKNATCARRMTEG